MECKDILYLRNGHKVLVLELEFRVRIRSVSCIGVKKYYRNFICVQY